MTKAFLDQLRIIVGDKHVLTASDETLPHYIDYRGRFIGSGLAVVKPADTQEVADIVRLCAQHHVPIVPQGGNTGLVGGSIPYAGTEVVINLSRLSKIRSIDPGNFTMAVDAGCVLSVIQSAAQEQGRLFPLSLASEGSAQIGGCIAANAGGILTIRYGNTRDLILGLEVVLPNGEIWNGMRSLRKDNTGYDLKQLFIGSEGTLGIVTGAVLKLFPTPGRRETFFAAVDELPKAITLLSHMRAVFGESILAFELIARRGIEFALKYMEQGQEPVAAIAPWYVLVEITDDTQSHDLRNRIEDALAQAFEKNLIADATLAQSDSQRQQLWNLREGLLDGQRYEGASIKNDVSVPVYKIPEFVDDVTALVKHMIPGIRPVIFGHVGDGNLHVNLSQPVGADATEFLACWDEIGHAINDIVQKYQGSIAAEHGVGTFKAAEIAQRKAPVEIAMMRKLKHAIDPQNIMNPGKVLL